MYPIMNFLPILSPHRLQDNGLPFCVSEGTLQCPCLENFAGAFCDECAEGYFGFPNCSCKNLNSTVTQF